MLFCCFCEIIFGKYFGLWFEMCFFELEIVNGEVVIGFEKIWDCVLIVGLLVLILVDLLIMFEF